MCPCGGNYLGSGPRDFWSPPGYCQRPLTFFPFLLTTYPTTLRRAFISLPTISLLLDVLTLPLTLTPSRRTSMLSPAGARHGVFVLIRLNLSLPTSPADAPRISSLETIPSGIFHSRGSPT